MLATSILKKPQGSSGLRNYSPHDYILNNTCRPQKGTFRFLSYITFHASHLCENGLPQDNTFESTAPGGTGDGLSGLVLLPV
jgi:hypothetical protein